MSRITPKEIILKLIDEVWNKGNLDVVDELVCPKYEIKNDPGDAYEFKTLNLSTFKQRVKFTRDAFPDVQFNIKDLLCEDGKVAISWFMSGTQEKDLPNLPAAGKKINVSGLTIYYVSEGKITGHWQVFDRLNVLIQLEANIVRNGLIA